MFFLLFFGKGGGTQTKRRRTQKESKCRPRLVQKKNEKKTWSASSFFTRLFIYVVTTSFSTNELTLTASITNITDAHNSFDISLERDDGTMLQNHTLMEGETISTFTQVESSYGTYNYVVKINGTQTDAYEAKT